MIKHHLPKDIHRLFHAGTVIPAHLLALTPNLRIDERRQRALTRHYLDAGVGGIAIAVHTTQFSLREHGLYSDVLKIMNDEVNNWSDRPIVKIAGVTGDTDQACREAESAKENGFHIAMVNVAGFKGQKEKLIVEHMEKVSSIMPVLGFYLLPECGGVDLSRAFWKDVCALPNLEGIKVASFNRYRTQDVIQGLVDARAEDRVTLYTGNDDHIVADLCMPFVGVRDGKEVDVRFKGGLLGHYAVWTQHAVRLFNMIKDPNAKIAELLKHDAIQTQINDAIYDSENLYAGCISGLHEVLRQAGLLEHCTFLDPNEKLSPGQLEKIADVRQRYPEWTDDSFIQNNLDRWLS